MGKYFKIFQVGVSEVFVWKLNFVLWRVRVVLRILLLYFLWSTIFLSQENVFGYNREQILAYVLGVSFLTSLILSSRTQDIAGEIREGWLTNFLMRPISYFGWWWMRDAVDKVINIVFATLELGVLYFLLRPGLFLQTNITAISLTVAAVILAAILWFYFSFLVSLFAFWIAEVWGIRFLLFIALEFLSGGTFPLDILPAPIFQLLSLTPFPYLLYFPLKIYLGQLTTEQIMVGFSVLVAWIGFSVVTVKFLWMRGLVSYGGEGG